MYRYPLPVLTCLFRATEQVDSSFLGANYVSRTNMVAYEHLTRSLARVGFSGAEITLLDRWLTTASYDSAADGLRRVEALGLRPTMTAGERQRALRVVTGGDDTPERAG